VGLLLADWGVDALRSFAPADLPRLSEIRVDGGVVAFAAGAALLAALVFGIAPAWSVTRRALGEYLKDSPDRATGGARGNAVRQGLVVAQLALSLVLVTGAGLLLRSLIKLQGVDLGFAHRGILTFQLQLPLARYGDDAPAGAFHDRLLEKLRALPGVSSAETMMGLPLTTDRYARLALQREGFADDPSHPTIAHFAAVSPGLLGLLRVPVVEGRGLSGSDTLDRQKVAVVNREFARRFYPGQSAVGRRVSLRQHPKAEDWTTIVGVVGDFRDESAESAPAPQIYTPYVQNTSNGFFVLVATTRDRNSLIADVRHHVAAIDPEQPIYGVQTFDDIVADSFGQPRFRATLLGGFGLLALALAAIGIYGVMAYSVSQRTREIGIRMALGAAAADVVGLVLRQAVRLSAVAVGAGLVGAAALSRGLASLLYGVRPIDPATFAGVAILLLGVAALAAWIPARRAARVDPIAALRNE
jgi:putative ABC transport system permease protein